MKNSGIEWIGEIPDGWNVASFAQTIDRISTGLNPRDNFKLSKDGDEFYYVTIRNFKEGRLYLNDKCDRISKQDWDIIQKRSDLKVGDLLFASISDEPNAYLISQEPKNWNINESVFTIRCKNTIYINDFFYYLLINYGLYATLRSGATGTTFKSIKQNDLLNAKVVVPSLAVQLNIVKTLDAKCGKIDELIANQEKQIEKLKEYKQSVITEAVTKGLDKSAPMKDSGIYNIGYIPEKWNVRRLKTLVTICNGKEVEVDDGEVPVYGSGGVFKYTNKILHSGVSMLYGRKGTIDKPILVNDSFWTVDTMFYTSEIHDVIPKYLYYCSVSLIDFTYYKSGSVLPSMTQTELGRSWLTYPLEQEQQLIVDYLDEKCGKIDHLIAIKQEKIEKLQEYKKSLIYEYVTGKKEVV